MITRISSTMDCCGKMGYSHPPADKPIGGEFPYLTGKSAGRYVVPAATKLTGKCMSLSVRTGKAGGASRNAEIAGIVNSGVWAAYIGAVQLIEYRMHDGCLPNIAAAGDEMVTPFYNAFQSPGIGEGVICPAGSTFTLKVTPAYNTNLVWFGTVFGKNSSNVADIQSCIALTATTTAGQTILTYTPASDWTILAIELDVEVAGQFAGQARIDYNGRQIIETPYIGLGESSSNMFDDKGFLGYGHGALNIPLWGIEFYPGENIDFFPIPATIDQSVWGLTIAGTESTLGGGTTGPTSWAY